MYALYNTIMNLDHKSYDTCLRWTGNEGKCGIVATLAQNWGNSFNLERHLSIAANPNKYILLVGGFFRASKMNLRARFSDM